MPALPESSLALLLPAAILVEIAYLLFALIGVAAWRRRLVKERAQEAQAPLLVVSCIITCYSEGRDVQRTIESLAAQDYAGIIEIIPVIDGASANQATWRAALAMAPLVAQQAGRRLRVVPKWIRGGRASSLNAGLGLAIGQLVMALDGDTSYDRDMVRRAVGRFRETGLVALAGTLRVRNAGENWLTRLQALDYGIFRQFVRAGLGQFHLVSNIPGAHGIFRRDLLRLAGGWDTGSAEDVDLAFRLKKLCACHRHCHLSADPHVISLTDVPASLEVFLRQRLRWEGDPAYLYLRKHPASLRPGVMGWRDFFFALWYGGIYQMALPLVMLAGVLLLPFVAEAGHVAQIAMASYLLWLTAFSVVFGVHLAWVSERRRADARLLAWLPVYPLFVAMLRLWSAAAVLHSLLLRSHLDSSMAPWWVLRKGRF